MMFSRGKQRLETGALRSGCGVKPMGETLAPVMEGPTPEEFGNAGRKEGSWGGLQQWMKGVARTPSMSRTPSSMPRPSHQPSTGYKRSDLRLLLGVLGAPLAPVPVSSDPVPHLSIKNTPIETSSAQYIVQQYIAATGGSKLHSTVRNAYVMGKVKMFASEFETATKVVKARNPSKIAETGCFVLWQMMPDMWYVEMEVEGAGGSASKVHDGGGGGGGGSKVRAGSNGKIVWRHTPWLGSHAAKGPVRPLRRALQGLDPRTIASMFATARCVGEKKVRGEDCFILKLSADRSVLAGRSDGPAEIIRHVMLGFFSQRTGLLVQIEDSHLTRIQSEGGDAVYWETTMDSTVEDYRAVDGIRVAHGGKTVVTLFRFGEVAMSHSKSRMEERWSIEEVEFNVQGLSLDCFIPPADIISRVAAGGSAAAAAASMSEVVVVSDLPRHHHHTGRLLTTNKVAAALDKPQEHHLDTIIWRVEV